MKLRKKYAVWLLFLCVLLICSLAPSVYAESDVEKELNETIDEQLGGIDWSARKTISTDWEKTTTSCSTEAFSKK